MHCGKPCEVEARAHLQVFKKKGATFRRRKPRLPGKLLSKPLRCAAMEILCFSQLQAII